jgi:hypothetical protein
MDTTSLGIQNHSARLRMELRVDGAVLSISHLGPDYLILARPVDYPPTRAEIAMLIDGNRSHWPVQLPAGLSVASRRTLILPCPSESNGSAVEPPIAGEDGGL